MTSGDRAPRVVVGLSGLDGAGQAHRAAHPGADASEARLYQGMGAAAALVIDHVVVAAAAQERYSHVKQDERAAVDALRACLIAARLTLDDIDTFALAYDFDRYASRLAIAPVFELAAQRARFEERLGHATNPGRWVSVRHHDAHAAACAASSGWTDGLIIVMDGIGEVESTSVHLLEDGRLRRLASRDARSSLGITYSLLTMHLGLRPNLDEHKVMALASFGDPMCYRDVACAMLALGPRGTLSSAVVDASDTLYRSGRAWLASRTFPPRDAGPFAQQHCDLAAAVQTRIGDAVMHVCQHWLEKTCARRLALSGGVALNCVANARLLNLRELEALHVDPAPADDGTALGAAAAAAGGAVSPALPLLGDDAGDGWELARHGGLDCGSPQAAAAAAAELLAAGAIVGWVQGRMEYGPRALGARSIIADARRVENRDRINRVIKRRESFQPLAPAVTAEAATTYFDVDPRTTLRTMSIVVGVRERGLADVPAVCHVDASARVQIVRQDEHPLFWALINDVGERTGTPVIVNTSLNGRDQPIARTVHDALDVYHEGELDALVVGRHVLRRRA